ncbi:6-phosphogluconolactonase [Thioalkalivibrio sulfidiphilus]|uniref:6-phosphogluconolactonase n=1 Tax=Thioalkalivibrio sulfidiphilus TaxID=1033854 RepID=UPI0009DB2D23
MNHPREPQVRIHADPEELAATVASEVLDLAARCIRAHGVFRIALAGGRTPRALYEHLAQIGPGHGDWSHWEIFYGDERCVPQDDLDSNHRMAREAWLDRVPIPPERIHPMVTDPNDPEGDARRYGAVLSDLPRREGMPVFDLVLLGLGPDGHTASLFPGTDILEVTDRPVAAVYVPQKGSWRISLTRPALEQADALWFLVTGADKADTVARVLHPAGAEDAALPAALLAPARPPVWHLDRDAARSLSGDGGD